MEREKVEKERNEKQQMEAQWQRETIRCRLWTPHVHSPWTTGVVVVTREYGVKLSLGKQGRKSGVVMCLFVSPLPEVIKYLF